MGQVMVSTCHLGSVVLSRRPVGSPMLEVLEILRERSANHEGEAVWGRGPVPPRPSTRLDRPT